MNNLTHFFSNEFVAALGWSLLHSLWQGALIALLLGIVLLFLQKRSSNLRYTLAASSLGLTLVAFFGTFAYLFNAAKSQQQVFNDTLYIVTQENYHQLVNQVTESQSLFSIFLAYFNEHLPIIVVFWLLGVLVLSLRFLGGLAYLKRLRYTQNQAIDKHWQERLNSIKLQIGLNKSVQLLESALIKVPMVIGYMKPLVLLPIGTINALSAAEVEAILAHELAHIKRNDYLINLIQSIIDVLFFYHPAVWLMSNTVRTERENCCDDLALSVTGNSLIIAKALSNLESLRQRSYHLSLAFTGNKNQLFNRISRLLGQPMKKNNHFVEGLVAVIVIILCLTTINYKVSAAVTEIEEERTEMVTDSIIPKTETILEEGEEAMEEYIIIEEEVKIPVAPIPPFPISWMQNENFVFPELSSLPKVLFLNEFESVDGTITKWIRGDDGKLILEEFIGGSARFPISALAELEITFPANTEALNTFFEIPKVPTLIFDNSSNFDGELSDENYEYKWKLNKSKGFKVKKYSIDAIADTSILEDAEVIIIDGEKITVIRKKSKLSKSEKTHLKGKVKRLEHLERLNELDRTRIEGQAKRVEIQLEATERRLEAEKERLEHNMKALEKHTQAQEERMKAQSKRMEIHSKEIMKAQEKRMQAQEERMKAQEERMRELEIRNKERVERQKIQNEKLEQALRKDGVLKEGEKLKTLNINENNGKVTMKVNGQKLSEEESKKYIKIMKE